MLKKCVHTDMESGMIDNGDSEEWGAVGEGTIMRNWLKAKMYIIWVTDTLKALTWSPIHTCNKIVHVLHKCVQI